MKIRDRINLGFLTLALLGLVGGGVGQYAIDRNVDRFELIVDETAPGLRELGEVEGEIHRIISESVSIALLYRVSVGTALREAIAEEEQELNEAWAVLRERVGVPGNESAVSSLPLTQSEIRRLRGDLLELQSVSTAIVDTARAAGPGTGTAIRVAEQKERLEDLEDDLEALLRQAALRQSASLDEQRQAAQRFAEMTTALNLIIALCAMGFVVYFAVFLNRKITRPLSRLQAATLGSGSRQADADFLNLSELPRSGADEIGQLSDALRTMDRRLRASTVSRDYVNAILESMSDMLIVLDADHRILTVNRAVCESLGEAPEELIGRSFLDVLASGDSSRPKADEPADLASLNVFETQQLSGEGVSTHRMSLRAASGEAVPVAFAAARLEGGETRGLVCVARDIRVDLRREAELRDAREAAESASRAKSEFLMNLSHEIRTPLHSVVGLADLLEESELSVEQQGYVSSLSRASQALLHLINNFLDLSRIEVGGVAPNIVPIELRKFIAELREIYLPQAAAKGLELHATVNHRTPERVLTDLDLLRRILGNLIGNGIKFTAAGSVSLTVEADQPRRLRFVIEDTGVGVPFERREQIFEAFEQADNSITRIYGGTGLGLAISRRLTDVLNGHIILEETPAGSGARFVVELPVEIADESRASASKRTALADQRELESRSGRGGSRTVHAHDAGVPGPRVLLVEDNENNQMLVRAFLKRTAVRLELAEDGRAALELLETARTDAAGAGSAVSTDAGNRLPYDLILMDMQMPVMDGYTATRAIRAREAEFGLERTPIVALTAHALDDARARSLEAGCDEHVVKPIGKQDLIDLIGRYAPAAPNARPEFSSPE
ncbi:MAG: ATP-binding protein [bacterium]|nr:ATP-binding protein [bacterium]